MPLPARLPPNPPDPRMNSVDWFSKMTLPVCLSLVSTMAVTAAALPLSKTSINLCGTTQDLSHSGPLGTETYRASFTSSPLVGMGALIAKYCSPWSNFACMPVQVSHLTSPPS